VLLAEDPEVVDAFAADRVTGPVPPPHHRPLPRIAVVSQRNHGLNAFGQVLVSSLKSANPICYVASTGSVRVSSSADARDVRDRDHGHVTLGVGYGELS
jgi:hypothetical protein